MVQYFPVITGSLTVNGDIIVSGTSSMSASNSVSSSYAYTASSAVSSSYAYSASSAVNSFSASKAVSSSYADTASFSNNFTVIGNLTVFGTQSVQYITSSQLNVSDNVITVNVASPGVRFGGLSVFDSGSLSSEATASLFWDSQNNHWIYQRESGSSYTGGMLISGPRNSAGLGNELGTTNCMLLVGQGGDHLTSSLVYHDSVRTCVPNILNVGGALSGSSATFSSIVGVGGATENGWSLKSNGNLKVENNNGTTVLQVNDTSTGGKTWSLISSGAGNAHSVPAGTFYLRNSTDGITTLAVSGCGNIGIGICNPSEKLDILGPNGSGAAVKWQNQGGRKAGYLYSDTVGVGIYDTNLNDAGIYLAGNVQMDFRVGGSQRMLINCSGIVNFSCKMCILVPTGANEQDAIIIDKALGFGQSFIRSYYANVPNYGMALRGGDGITAMYIQCQGYVGVGISTPGYKFHTVSPDNNTTSFAAFSALNLSQQVEMWYGGIRMGGSNASVDMNLQSKGAGTINFITNGATRMQIDGSGNIGAPSGTNIYNASDFRLKQNVASITDGLTKILGLNPVKFNWIDGFVPKENGKNMLGFIAQEVKTIVPEAVEEFNDGSTIHIEDISIENPLRVNEKFIIPVLTKAIQEQHCIICSQAAMINTLKTCIGIA